MKKLLATTCLFFYVISSYSQQYFVDGTNGNDANNGITLVTAWKTIQKSFDAVTPGSIVYIKGGTYKEQLTVNVSGLKNQPIEFRNYQNDSVYIDGTGLKANPMIDIEDDSNLIFRNLIIQNLVANNAVGIQIVCNAGAHVTNLAFKNLIVRNISWTSNRSTKPSSSKNSQPFIAYGEGTTAANVMRNILVDSCLFYNNITGFSESMSFGGYIDSVIVTNNNVHDNTNIGIDFTGNYTDENPIPSLNQVRNVLVRGNYCYNNISNYAANGGIYIDGARDILVERNICYNNGYGLEIGCEENGSASNVIVRDNLFYNNQITGLAIGGYTTNTTGQVLNCVITHNTFYANNYSNDGTGEIAMTKASNCIFQNNIFYTNSQNTFLTADNISPQTGNVVDYNCWYTIGKDSNNINVDWRGNSYSTWTQYKTGTGYDTHSIFADPRLVNTNIALPDFHLQSGSKCIDAGNPNYIVGINETDFDGKQRAIGRVDIGAYEFQKAPSNQICAGTQTSFTSNITGTSYQWQIDTANGFVNISTTDSRFTGVTTSSITINNASSSLNGFKFRSIVNTNFSDTTVLHIANYWSGTVSDAWENPLNWSCGQVPDINTDVIINTGAPNYPTVNANGFCKSLNVSPQATIIVKPGIHLEISGKN